MSNPHACHLTCVICVVWSGVWGIVWMAIINRFYEYQTDDDGRIVCFQTTGQLAGGLRTSVRTAHRDVRVLSGQTLSVENLALWRSILSCCYVWALLCSLSFQRQFSSESVS